MIFLRISISEDLIMVIIITYFTIIIYIQKYPNKEDLDSEDALSFYPAVSPSSFQEGIILNLLF